MTDINWGFVLGQALVEQRRQSDIADGIQAMVHLYYEDYTDATNLDAFLHVLLALGRHFHGLDEEDVLEHIRTAEQEIRDSGRQVRSVEDEDEEV